MLPPEQIELKVIFMASIFQRGSSCAVKFDYMDEDGQKIQHWESYKEMK